MPNPPRKHHYVPRSLLRFFSVDGAGNQIHVFDKENGNAFTTSLMDAGSQKDFNRLNTDSGSWMFEHLFDDVDFALSERVKAIHATPDIAALSFEDRRAWADLAAVQLVRTPLIRASLGSFPTALLDQIEKLGLSAPENVAALSDNDTRRIAVALFAERDGFRESLQEKDLVLFRPSGTHRFLISDHPIVMRNTAPHGDIGLRAPGIAIFFPLGSELVLGFLCPSIRVNLEAAVIDHLPAERRASLLALRETLRTGKPMAWTDAEVDGLNAMQIETAARFLYSHKSDFSQARRIMAKIAPDGRKPSLVHVGDIGRGPPPAPDMPDGDWLVVFGHRNHGMIALSTVCDDPLEVVTHDVATVQACAADEPIAEIRLYRNRHIRQSKRNVRLTLTPEGNAVRVQVRFADPALDALDRRIAETRVPKR